MEQPELKVVGRGIKGEKEYVAVAAGPFGGGQYGWWVAGYPQPKGGIETGVADDLGYGFAQSFEAARQKAIERLQSVLR